MRHTTDPKMKAFKIAGAIACTLIALAAIVTGIVYYRDTLVDGYLSAGGKIDPVFGMAQPFFKDKNYVQESKNCPAASASASTAPSAPK